MLSAMRITDLVTLPRFFILLMCTGSLVLAGCAAAGSNGAGSARQSDSQRDTDQQTAARHGMRAALSPGAAATSTPQIPTLPEAGSAHPTTQASPTRLQPAPQPVKPTASPTQVPVKISPTPDGYFAPAAPARIIIPAIGLDAPVMAVGWSVVDEGGQQISEWDVPGERAAGWLNSSALVGARGNTVLVGHQDIDGRVFENLEYLKQGDEIQVQAADSRIRKYIVTVMMIVPEKDQPMEVRRANARWIGSSNDERVTLVTCWPRNDNTHRLILVALPAT